MGEIKDIELRIPSSKTDLTIGVADLTAEQIAVNLNLLSALIVGVREGYARKKNDHEYVIAVQGACPFVNASFEHEEWDGEDYYGEAFMCFKEYQKGTTIFTIPARLAEWFKTDKTCCEYFRERDI